MRSDMRMREHPAFGGRLVERVTVPDVVLDQELVRELTETTSPMVVWPVG
jgi:hypothetical protein